MVTINANLDLKSFEVLDTGRLNKDLVDLCNEKLGITFVARDREFFNEAWQKDGKTYMRVVLPYEEVLSTDNIDLLAYVHLHKHLDKLDWLDKEKIRRKLEEKMDRLKNAASNEVE